MHTFKMFKAISDGEKTFTLTSSNSPLLPLVEEPSKFDKAAHSIWYVRKTMWKNDIFQNRVAISEVKKSNKCCKNAKL